MNPDITKIIFYTDIHMNSQFTDFAKADGSDYTTDRFKIQIDTLKGIYDRALEENAMVVFAGDMFHERTKVDINTFNKTYGVLNDFSSSSQMAHDMKKVFLRGNHDSINESMGSPSSIDLFTNLPNAQVVSTPDVIEYGCVRLYMLPYSNDNKLMKETINEWAQGLDSNFCNILVGHLGVDGSFGVGNRKIEGPFTVDDMHPEAFDQVYLGHYHARQNLAENVSYGGSTIENSFSDAGTEKGYDILSVSPDTPHNLDFQFVPSTAPKFVTATTLEEAKKNLDDGNYVKLEGNATLQKSVTTLDDSLREHLRFTKLSDETKEVHIDSDRMDSPKQAVKAYVEEVDPTILEESLSCLNEALKG